MNPETLDTSYKNLLMKAQHIKDLLDIKELPSILMDDDRESPPVRGGEQILYDNYLEDSLKSIKTVRFLKDYDAYNAAPDQTTKNLSFLRTAEVFRLLGVKNYYFCLQINNPALIGVDPHSTTLTEEQKLMVLHECRQNFWYFVREVCRLNGDTAFHGNRANISFMWCYLCHITTILILFRQAGKSVSAQVILFWLEYIVGKGYQSHFITLKDGNRAQFIEAIKTIRSSCPEYLTNVTYRDKDAGNSLTYSAFGEKYLNKLTVSVPQIGKDAAGNVGRGLAIKTDIRDEPAYVKWIEEIVNGAGPSGITARQIARDSKEPYGSLYMTTPNSTTNDSGRYMYDMLMNSTEWREVFFDSYNESHLVERLIKSSPKSTTSPTVGMVFNYLQLGKSKDWVKHVVDEFKLSHAKARIDLLLMWEDEGKDKLFDDLTREALNEGKRGIQWSLEVGNTGLFLDWFISKDEYRDMISGVRVDTHFIIGCDTSGAVDKDACTIVIRDIRDLKVVGVGRYGLAFLTDVGNVLIDLLVTIPNSTLIIERNYAAHMIDQLLIMLPALGIDPFKRIFNQIYNDPVKYDREFREIQQRTFNNRTKDFYLRYKASFGFNTGKVSREELYGLLQECVGLSGGCIYYVKLIDEIIDLKTKAGRVDHGSNGHDDLVIAWLLTFWFIKLAKSKSYYNIPPGIAMTNMSVLRVGAEKTNNIIEDKRTNIYRNKLNVLTDKLMLVNDPIVVIRLEHEINKLAELIPNDIRKTFTIDTLILAAKNARAKRALELKKRRIY